MHQTRNSGKTGGRLAIFIHNSLAYSVKKDLSTNNEDVESLCIEILILFGQKLQHFSNEVFQPSYDRRFFNHTMKKIIV